jgi:AcrR family transcriptional regulator
MAAATSDVDERGIPIIDEPVSSSQRRRRAIVDAAVAEFLREGYSAASVEEIARRARVSKPTIYNHFGNKERLFLAVIAGVLTNAYTGIDPQSSKITEASDLGAALTAYIGAWSRRVLCEDILALRRLVIGEVSRFPQLGRLWFDLTHEMMDTPLIEALTALDERKTLRIPDPRQAARQLIGMTLGALQLIHTFLPERELDDADFDQTIAEGVAVFLSHYGTA